MHRTINIKSRSLIYAVAVLTAVIIITVIVVVVTAATTPPLVLSSSSQMTVKAAIQLQSPYDRIPDHGRFTAWETYICLKVQHFKVLLIHKYCCQLMRTSLTLEVRLLDTDEP